MSKLGLNQDEQLNNDGECIFLDSKKEKTYFKLIYNVCLTVGDTVGVFFFYRRTLLQATDLAINAYFLKR